MRVGHPVIHDIVGSSDVTSELGDQRWQRLQAYHHALDNIRRYRYGWAIKVLWLIRPGWTQSVTLMGETVGTGQPIWFRTGGIHPQGPVASLVLDPTNPETPDVHHWANFPSSLLLPRASCYSLTATWSGGKLESRVRVREVEMSLPAESDG